MKKTQKIFLAAAAIIVIAALGMTAWYFWPKTFLSGIEPSAVKSIHVFDGNTGKEYVIDDVTDVSYIVENIRGVEMKRGKISAFKAGYSLRMVFCDGGGKEIDSFIMNSADTIRDDPFFYSCDGGLCYDYLKELEDRYIK